MADGDESRLERLVCWIAGYAGFDSIEAEAIHTSVRRLGYLAAFAWVLALAGSLFDIISPLAGMSVLSFVTAVMAGGVLLAARTNAEIIQSALDLQPDAVADVEDEAPVEEALPPQMHEPVLPVARPFRPEPIAQERRLLSRGQIDGRAYAIYTDGSIEMETAFGRRWFASIDLAHEFIGYRPGQAEAAPAPIRPADAILN